MAKLLPHKLCSIFPSMKAEDLGRLRKSIRDHGFDKTRPIVLLDGLILEGKNRYEAAHEEGMKDIEIPQREFNIKKDGDPILFVMKENLARRHMTPAQCAAAGVDLVDAWKAAEAAEAELAKQKGEKAPKKAKGSKVHKAAKIVGASPRQVAAAAAIKKADPKKFEKIKTGESSVNKADKAAKAKKDAEAKKTDPFKDACATIDKVLGAGFSDSIKNRIAAKELIKMSGLEEEEMRRISPLIQSGWTLKKAIDFKITSLSHAHNIRQLCERADANGGNFTLEIGHHKIEVTKIIPK
jgi:hypothetical protein